MNAVIVIVSSLDENGNITTQFKQNCISIGSALTIGESRKEMGVHVLVRPNYNETKDNGKKYFREWRSFNGNAFEEVSWDINFG